MTGEGYKVATTRELLAIAKAARFMRGGRLKWLKNAVDPGGLHVVWFSLQHDASDRPDIRTFWFIKRPELPDPMVLRLDVPVGSKGFGVLSSLARVTSADEYKGER